MCDTYTPISIASEEPSSTRSPRPTEIRGGRQSSPQFSATLADKADWHTVVPGTTEDTITPTLEAETIQTAGQDFGVDMNPEFLREGTAVHGFLDPNKVVLGADDDQVLAAMHEVFDPLVNQIDASEAETDTCTAEMIKCANNGSYGEGQLHQREHL